MSEILTLNHERYHYYIHIYFPEENWVTAQKSEWLRQEGWEYCFPVIHHHVKLNAHMWRAERSLEDDGKIS